MPSRVWISGFVFSSLNVKSCNPKSLTSEFVGTGESVWSRTSYPTSKSRASLLTNVTCLGMP